MTLAHLSFQHVPHRNQPVAWTNEERVRSFRAMFPTAQSNAYPWPFKSPLRSLSGNSPLRAGQAAEPSDYRPEMADCPGW